MKSYLWVFVFTTLAVPAASIAASVPSSSCSEIKWNTKFLHDYPKAAAACREVTVKDGVKYATFNGQVSKVGRHLVEVDVFNVADTPIDKIGFQVGTGGRVTMGDKETKVKDLRVGDHIMFWVREGRYGVSPILAERPLKIVKPTAMPEV